MANQAHQNLREIMRPGPDCLSAEELETFIDPGASGNPVFEQHLRNCPRCRGELALMRSFLSDEVTPSEKPHVDAIVRKLESARPARRKSFWKQVTRRWAWAPALAAAALLVVFVVNPGRDRIAGDIVVSPGSGVFRSNSVDLIQPAGEVAQLPSTIEWKPVSGASGYRVRLLETDRTLVWQSATAATTMAAPPELKRAAVPGRWLMLEIDALNANGDLLTGSGPIRFRVQPRL